MTEHGIWKLADSKLDLSLEDEFKAKKVIKFMEQFMLSDDDIYLMKRLFQEEMDQGLKTPEMSESKYPSLMAMKMTFFTELFEGNESGEFVVINITAQHLEIALALVKPGFHVKTIRKYYTVDENIRREPYMKIFELICDSILNFFTEHNMLSKMYAVGICSDLPTTQFSLDKAIVWYFTPTASNFPLNCYDIKKCFEMVLLRERYKEIKLEIVAIMSNNTSLFLHSSYIYGKIDISLNLENDCDLLYFENISLVNKWKFSKVNINEVLIDTELRNFGGNGKLDFIATELDRAVIKEPLNSSRMDTVCRLEKFLSEEYLWELMRHTFLELYHQLLYCRDHDLVAGQEVQGITLNDVINLANIKDADQGLLLLLGGYAGGTTDDTKIARYVCKMILIRAAVLIAVCLSSILLKFEKDELVIAVKSPLLLKHPDFETYVRNITLELAPRKKFQLLPIEDLCLEGAALGAAIASRNKSHNHK